MIDGLGLWRHAGRAHLARARADRRARAPSAVPGGGSRQGAPGRALRSGEGRAGAGRGVSSSPAATRRARSPPISRCPATRSPSPSPAPTRRRARQRHRRSRCSCSRVGSIVPRKAYDIARARAGPAARTATGGSPSPARPTAARRRLHGAAGSDPRDRPGPTHRAHRRRRPGAAGQHLRVRRSPSSCRRSTRATAWCWRRPWRAGCRSSAPPAAPRPRPCPTPPPSRCRPATRALGSAIGRVLDDAGSAPAHGRCLLGRRPEAAALGGYGAHHRRRHRGACAA